MSKTQYYLFPDLREDIGGQVPLEGEFDGDGADLIRSFVLMDYPALVVFREFDQTRWSYATIMPKMGEPPDGG